MYYILRGPFGPVLASLKVPGLTTTLRTKEALAKDSRGYIGLEGIYEGDIRTYGGSHSMFFLRMVGAVMWLQRLVFCLQARAL